MAASAREIQIDCLDDQFRIFEKRILRDNLERLAQGIFRKGTAALEAEQHHLLLLDAKFFEHTERVAYSRLDNCKLMHIAWLLVLSR